jgi:hypothetical protein
MNNPVIKVLVVTVGVRDVEVEGGPLERGDSRAPRRVGRIDRPLIT